MGFVIFGQMVGGFVMLGQIVVGGRVEVITGFDVVVVLKVSVTFRRGNVVTLECSGFVTDLQIVTKTKKCKIDYIIYP